MPRLPSLLVLGALFIFATCSASAGAAATSSAQAATDPATTQAPPRQAQADVTPQSHLLEDPPVAASAVDPLPSQAAGAAGGLPPGRTRRPLVHTPDEAPRIVPIGSEIPDGPVAAADAPAQACADPRPTACNLDYKPVCADVDTGVRCIAAPCPSSERKTYSSACKACREPKVGHYVSGTCPKP
jgi:hypothetical protein